MTINNPTYSSKSVAKRGAERAGIANPEFVKRDDGRVEVRDMDRPLYNSAAREKSEVKGAVRIVWDLCAEMIPTGAKRRDVVGKAVELGVALNTARTQYQHYRKAAGLTRK